MYKTNERRIGKGGQGEVYRYTNGKAIKYTKSGPKNYRFNREFAIAKIAGNLGVGPRVYNRGRNGNNLWYTMNLLNGKPLASYMMNLEKAQIANNRKRQIKTELNRQITNKVRRLHNAGIAHMDLHEGNIIVTDNAVYIIDYGASNFPKSGNKLSENNITRYLNAVSGGVRWNRNPAYFVVKDKLLLSNGEQLARIKRYLQ